MKTIKYAIARQGKSYKEDYYCKVTLLWYKDPAFATAFRSETYAKELLKELKYQDFENASAYIVKITTDIEKVK